MGDGAETDEVDWRIFGRIPETVLGWPHKKHRRKCHFQNERIKSQSLEPALIRFLDVFSLSFPKSLHASASSFFQSVSLHTENHTRNHAIKNTSRYKSPKSPNHYEPASNKKHHTLKAGASAVRGWPISSSSILAGLGTFPRKRRFRRSRCLT